MSLWEKIADKMVREGRLEELLAMDTAIPAVRRMRIQAGVATEGDYVAQAQHEASTKQERAQLAAATLAVFGGAALGAAGGTGAASSAGGAEAAGAYGGMDAGALAGADFGAGASGAGAFGAYEAPVMGGTSSLSGGGQMMPAAVLDTGGSAMMPAAQPASAAQIGEWGLTQTAPGVYTGATASGMGSPSELGFEQSAPSTGGSPSEIGFENTPPAGGGQGGIWEDIKNLMQPGGAVQTGRDVLGLGGSLLGLYNANKANDALRASLQAAGANTQPQYDYSQNWGLVDQYMRDPMSLLRNNAGYQASVDFLDKENRRKMAGTGYTGSGNKEYVLADVLGKNAQQWYQNMWSPIRDAAGLGRPDQSAQLLGAQTNALNQIETNKREGLANVFQAGSRALPSIFKFALG